MTIEELIKQLQAIEDKTKHVYAWDSEGDIRAIAQVDVLDDRIDLNLCEECMDEDELLFEKLEESAEVIEVENAMDFLDKLEKDNPDLSYMCDINLSAVMQGVDIPVEQIMQGLRNQYGTVVDVYKLIPKERAESVWVVGIGTR